MEISDDKFVELFENVASIKTSNTNMCTMLITVQSDIRELNKFNQIDIPIMIKKEVNSCQARFHPDSDQPEEIKKDNVERRRLTIQELKYKKALTISVWIGVLSLVVGILLSVRALI